MVRILRVVVVLILSAAWCHGPGIDGHEGKTRSASQGERNHAHARQRRDPLCGPHSLWVAARRVGLSVDFGEVKRASNATEAGTSMLDLKRAAEAMGLTAKGLRLSWGDLLNLHSPAILYVSDDHFICVDPRESDMNRPPVTLRVYDLPAATTWRSRREISDTWQGEALVITRPESARRPITGPAAQLDSTIADFGVTKPDSVTSHSFLLRNIGTENLEIRGLKKSCGCTRVAAARNVVPPGEAEPIVVTLDLHGRHGPQSHQAFVLTNAPQSEMLTLVYRGVVRKPVRVSSGLIQFAEVVPGCTAQESIVLTDRGGQDLEVTEGRVIIDSFLLPRGVGGSYGFPCPTPEPAFEVRCVSLSRGPSSEGESRAESPIRYQVTVTARPETGTQSGTYEGRLELLANDLDSPKITVPLILHVVQDEHITPSRLSFGILRPGQTSTRTITLQRRTGQSVQLRHCTLQSSPEDKIAPKIASIVQTGENVTIGFTLTMPPLPGPIQERALKGQIVLLTTQGKEIMVQWIAVCEAGAEANYRTERAML